MNQLQKVFEYEDYKVRTVLKDDEVYFVAKDVCGILNHSNHKVAISRLDEDEVSKVYLTDSIGRNQITNAVNESGLYSLVLTSNKKEAKQFKKWITKEVLPTIRKTGGYVANDDLFINTYLPHADEQTKTMFKATLENVRKLNDKVEELEPKADYFDALVERNLLLNFRDTAKELHIGQKKFINWLRNNDYIYRDKKGKWKPYMRHTPELFELKEWERNGIAGEQTLITPKGRETFRLLLHES